MSAETIAKRRFRRSNLFSRLHRFADVENRNRFRRVGVIWRVVLILCIPIVFATIGCEQKSVSEAPQKPQPELPPANRPDLLQSQSSKTSIALNKVFFLDENTGWVVGRNGVILHTVN